MREVMTYSPSPPWMCCINTVILINLIPHAFSNIRSIPVLSDTLSGFKPWSHLLLYVHPLLTLHLYCVCELSKDMGSPFNPSHHPAMLLSQILYIHSSFSLPFYPSINPFILHLIHLSILQCFFFLYYTYIHPLSSILLSIHPSSELSLHLSFYPTASCQYEKWKMY